MRLWKSHRPSARCGLSMVEAVLAIALLVLLLSSAILAASGGYGAFRKMQDATDTEARIRRALDRVASELLSVGTEELLPDPAGQFGTSSVLFRKAVGLNGLQVVWGDQNRIAFEYEPEETNDGTDEDGDGLIDEGRVVLVHDVGGADRQAVLCTGVAELLEGEGANGADDNGNGVIDEAGFNIHRVGEVLFLRLSLVETQDTGNIVRTLETSVRLRN